jgi:hypothetical protein
LKLWFFILSRFSSKVGTSNRTSYQKTKVGKLDDFSSMDGQTGLPVYGLL